jgi:hypothetical protein
MKPKLNESAAGRGSKPWHAVSIVCSRESCAAATSCVEKRFLAGEAPRLPLTDCGHPQSCPCTYRHFDDRRVKPRRASESGSPPRGVMPRVERRAIPERRQTNL